MKDHAPPQNLEAERGTIAAALLDNQILDDLMVQVSARDFYRAAHETIWKAIVRLYDRGEPIDALTLSHELTRRGQYREVGGDSYLAEIMASVPHAANGVYHAGIVRAKAITRELIQSATEIIREGYSNLHTPAELLDLAERRVFAVGEREATGQTRDMGEVIAEAYVAIAGREEGNPTGISTGFSELDYILDGFAPGDLSILAARPSQGKTALAMSIACNIAEMNRGHVLFCSLEMGRQAIADRLLASASNLDGYLLKRPWLMKPEQRQRLADAAEMLRSQRIKIDDTSSRTITQISANARRIANRDGLALVVIDYLSLIDGQAEPGESRQEEVAKISRRLKSMARNLNVPVLCLCQLNRQSEARKDRRPQLADLRESGQIEQDADSVLLLHRPEFYDPNECPGIAEIQVAKNRNGMTGKVDLAFVKACTRFDSMTRLPQEEIPNGQPY